MSATYDNHKKDPKGLLRRRESVAYLEIRQTGPLQGRYMVQGSKNAVLPMLAAALLHPGKTVLRHVPAIRDVEVMLELLELLGCRISRQEEELIIDAESIDNWEITPELMKRMRSSIILLAPVLYRMGKAAVIQPGGCSIGKRPIDLHLYVLQKMGVELRCENEQIFASTSGFQGADIRLSFPSVGATEQAILAGIMAEGSTCITNAAREPEISELCRLLRGMGARIEGDGEAVILIRGVKKLKDSCFTVGGDRIVTATCLSAVAVCGGCICLDGINPGHLQGVLEPFRRVGCFIDEKEEGLTAGREGRLQSIPFIQTRPYPGFPTDVQSLLMTVLTQADGQSVVEEGIFEGRFRTAYQLQKMGADIIIEGNRAQIHKSRLHGEIVTAPDLRGGAALAIAGLAAEGCTRVQGYEHIARGYEDLAGMLRSLGAETILFQ